MFSLTVVDHVRLDSEHVAQNYTVHARSAERIVRIVFALRLGIAALLTAATCAAIASVLTGGRATQIVTAVLAGVALCVFAVSATVGLEARLFAHRAFAHRLWLISERYRSLLSEFADGSVDGATLIQRRDELIHDLSTIYEFNFSIDQDGHETLRLAPVPDQRAA
jgi:SMODS and SLOG-associating 2TM effector domain family 4